MKQIRFLSYALEESIPVYGKKNIHLDITAVKSLANGDSCNTYRFSMENHWGTHIDTPAHFFQDAKTITDYRADFWIFKSPCVIKLSCGKNSVIKLKDIEGRLSKKHDSLFIKTGFSRFRGKKEYSFYNPAVSPEVGFYLRNKMPNIRAIGFDFISLGSFQNRDLLRQSHRAFLDPRGKGRPIVVIEDMDLSSGLFGLKSVLVAPLRIKRIDSAPCVVFGVFK